MAEQQKSSDGGGSATPGTNDDAQKTNTGTPSREAYATADVQAAEAAGVSEGEIKALRDEAGVNQSAGHMADIHAWSQSEAGKAFKDSEKDRIKREKEVAKARSEATNKDGLTDAESKYIEAVKG